MSESIRDLVHAEVDQKIQAGIRLEEAAQAHTDALERAQLAAKQENEARRAALAAGWTETQLRKLGLASKRSARTPRKRQSTKTDHNTGTEG